MASHRNRSGRSFNNNSVLRFQPNKEEIEFDNEGAFIGARIFEYSDSSFKEEVVKLRDKKKSTFVQSQHIIIAIYPDKETFHKLGELYTDWRLV